MDILIAGGAGYIGSHVVINLLQKGYNPIVVDNFSRSSCRYADNYLSRCTVIECDISNQQKIKEILATYDVQGVMHFAAYAYVGESVSNPIIYYKNNVSNSIAFLQSLLSFYDNSSLNIPPLLFSSTCSVYGETSGRFITEKTFTNPLNPYAKTKLIIENLLADLYKSQGMSSIALRYFNAAGSDVMLRAGEDHQPETHLIPLLIDAAENNSNKPFSIYGNDYPTRDGTCIRDYTHVSDIADAHILGLELLLRSDTPRHDVINLGSGTGFTNLEVLEAVEKISGKTIRFNISERREGDPPFLVADSEKARNLLGWQPKQSDLNTMIAHAYAWYCHRRSVN